MLGPVPTTFRVPVSVRLSGNSELVRLLLTSAGVATWLRIEVGDDVCTSLMADVETELAAVILEQVLYYLGANCLYAAMPLALASFAVKNRVAYNRPQILRLLTFTVDRGMSELRRSPYATLEVMVLTCRLQFVRSRVRVLLHELFVMLIWGLLGVLRIIAGRAVRQLRSCRVLVILHRGVPIETRFAELLKLWVEQARMMHLVLVSSVVLLLIAFPPLLKLRVRRIVGVGALVGRQRLVLTWIGAELAVDAVVLLRATVLMDAVVRVGSVGSVRSVVMVVVDFYS